MASSMPSESASVDNAVDTFGIGTYDYSPQGANSGPNGNKPHKRKALPDEGGFDGELPETLTSYPTNPVTTASSFLPADLGRSTGRGKPGEHYDSVVHSQAESALPSGREPSAMSAYRDPTVLTGSGPADAFADHSGDTFASDPLPSESKKEEVTGYLDSHYGPLSGKRIQDETDSVNPKDYPQGNVVMSSLKIATNHELVKDLAMRFIKDHGKKNITKRHVVAYLHSVGSYSFLSSDIIRYLNVDQNADVMDVLDVFPVRLAGLRPTETDTMAVRIASVREAFINAILDPSTPGAVLGQYNRIAADLALALSSYERSLNHA